LPLKKDCKYRYYFPFSKTFRESFFIFLDYGMR